MSLIPVLPRSDARLLAAVGLDSPAAEIKRTPDGKVDFDYYLLRARQLRSNAYARVVRAIGRGLAAWFKSIREQRKRKRALVELLSLDDRGLRDIGLNRAGVYFAVDHGREDEVAPANLNDKPSRSPKAA